LYFWARSHPIPNPIQQPPNSAPPVLTITPAHQCPPALQSLSSHPQILLDQVLSEHACNDVAIQPYQLFVTGFRREGSTIVGADGLTMRILSSVVPKPTSSPSLNGVGAEIAFLLT
jgi:hypothetical protein